MSEIKFELTEALCRLGKYTNCAENAGEEKVPYWALPCLELMLPAEQVKLLVADEYVDRSWFNTNKTNLQEPMPWLSRFKLVFQETFDEAHVEIKFSESQTQEFDNCRIKILSVEPRTTGVTEVGIQVQLFPNRKQLVLIHEHQYREVKLSVSNAKVAAKKKNKQIDAFEKPQGESANETTDTTTVLDGSHIAGAGDQTLIWWQHGETGEKSNGARCEMPAGCVEIDPPEGSRSEQVQEAQSADDSAEFEAGVAAAVGAHRKRGSNIIDGRSERVKHRDRQAAKGH